jgi:hypothetical protein
VTRADVATAHSLPDFELRGTFFPEAKAGGKRGASECGPRKQPDETMADSKIMKDGERDDRLIRDVLKNHEGAPSVRLRRDNTTIQHGTALPQASNVRQIAEETGMRLLVGQGYVAIAQYDMYEQTTTFLVDRE